MNLLSLHPGVSADMVRENTSFEVIVPKDISVTDSPTPHEVELIRTKIDPLNLRIVESASGKERLKLLRRSLEEEKGLSDKGQWEGVIK
jgi:hypothetical protein